MPEKENWYVVYTIPRWEKKVADTLTQNNITNYCPLNLVEKRWSDRKKIIKEPLFKGYVFVKIPEDLKWKIKEIHGIVNFVYWLGKPAKILQREIDTIRKFLNEFKSVEVKQEIQVNKKVEITHGVFMNYKGNVIEVVGNKAKVFIKSMNISLTAVFNTSDLKIIG